MVSCGPGGEPSSTVLQACMVLNKRALCKFVASLHSRGCCNPHHQSVHAEPAVGVFDHVHAKQGDCYKSHMVSAQTSCQVKTWSATSSCMFAPFNIHCIPSSYRLCVLWLTGPTVWHFHQDHQEDDRVTQPHVGKAHALCGVSVWSSLNSQHELCWMH